MTRDYARPDPDALLQSIKEDEKGDGKRGKLKIFFGMAAGVGKTYAMLEEARRLAREGIDIVIGYVVTHGRVETEELVKGLEVIPRKRIDYQGLVIEEFDIDAVLARRPAVVLVDELAHTNAEGSRHAKRHQDVTELLDNGISVYSTLNVQHLESQADVVEKITEIKIRETVPDSVLDLADEIELIDIPPEELLKRLAEGKVYVPEKAGLAAERFFRKGNITALREMALHYTARLVGYELRDYTKKRNIKGPWKSGERLMVAVSPSPYSEYLIRWTRRMAFNLNAPWVALFVEKQKRLTPAAQDLLVKNLNLARELGAEVISTADESIVNGLLRTAHQMNVTQIVVGKPLRKYLSDFFSGGNLVERLLKSSGDIEIHVVTQPDVHGTTKVSSVYARRNEPIREYIIGAGTVLLVTLASVPLAGITGYWTIALIYLLCVVMISLYISRGPVLMVAALSALLWNFLFIPPLFTLEINKLEDVLMFGMYFIIATILGTLTSRLRIKERALRVREKRITGLYELSNAMGNALGLDEVVKTAADYIGDYFNAKVAFMLVDESGRLPAGPHAYSTLEISAKERGVVEWVYKNKKPAGLFTATLPHSEAHYIPLIAPGSVVGILGIRPVAGQSFSLEQESFLQNITYQISMRIEREGLSISNQRTRLMEESERLYKVLLNSISHELRTPLTTITGASTSMLDEAIEARPETRRALSEEIRKAGERLNRLVDNLLDMSRLESGMLKLHRQRHDLGDLVSVVLKRLGNELASRTVRVSIPEDMPLLDIDFALMEQVLANLLYNAILYTPPETAIIISGNADADAAAITVEDNGPGISEEDMPFVFEKFRRGVKTPSGGTGLGLSICKGIVEAHGGAIRADNKPQGGAVFTITIPLEEDDTRSGEGRS